MGQVLHGSATTTEAIRRAIQHSQASLRSLAKRYGINQKTVAKWKRRSSVVDLPTGPREPRSSVLSIKDEVIIVAFRRYTLLPLARNLITVAAALTAGAGDLTLKFGAFTMGGIGTASFGRHHPLSSAGMEQR